MHWEQTSGDSRPRAFLLVPGACFQYMFICVYPCDQPVHTNWYIATDFGECWHIHELVLLAADAA